MSHSTDGLSVTSGEQAKSAQLSCAGVHGRTNVLGILVSRTTYADAVERIATAATQHRRLTVAAVAVHAVMTGALKSGFGSALNRFDIVAPDGQPVRWALNALGKPYLPDRVYGPELTLRVCERAARDGIGVYVFGSSEATVTRFTANLRRRFPALSIVGVQADRFREATPDEDEEDVRRIVASGAGIVLVGRGCPRQEYWIDGHRHRIPAALLGVGAAFDFVAGTKAQAPSWLQRAGLEWLFRLVHEPRRLFKRYLGLNPLYVIFVTAQLLGLKRFHPIKDDEARSS